MGKYKQCKNCPDTFFSESGKEIYCPACKIERKRERTRISMKKQRPLPPPKVAISDVMRWVRVHEEKTGVHLTYGRALEEMRKEGYSV